MGFVLERDISFCQSGGRVIFLDLQRDRYFCLGREAEGAFKRLAAGEALTASEAAALTAAGRQGWLSRVEGSPCVPVACARPPDVRETALEERGSRPDLRCLPPILFDLVAARRDLRRRKLKDIVRHLEGRKAATKLVAARSTERVQRIAATFQWSGLLSTLHDQCLPRSLAMMRHLVRHGHRPMLVFAVMTRPFAAHCWVQLGETVLNDQLDHVRKFTPILVV
jgi:hypothetical protein